VRADLQETLAQKQAIREYRYNALKNLYENFEPILFQFHELSEEALLGIIELARNAKKDKNENPEDLSIGSHFMKLTLYRLLAPLAAFKVLQSLLTMVDLKLDETKTKQFQYNIGKVIFYSFSDDFELATKCEPMIDYDPLGKDNNIQCDVRKENPAKHVRQGMYIGTIEIVSEALIVPNKKIKIKDLMEIQTQMKNITDIGV